MAPGPWLRLTTGERSGSGPKPEAPWARRGCAAGVANSDPGSRTLDHIRDQQSRQPIAVLGFTHLAATTPPERIGRTMGSAELGREAGDAGGPLIVGAIATTVSLAAGLGTLATLIAVIAVVCTAFLRHDTRPRTQCRCNDRDPGRTGSGGHPPRGRDRCIRATG